MKLLYFDYAAIIILALLLFTNLIRGLYKGRLNRCYIQLLIVGLVSATADIMSAYTDNLHSANLFIRYMSHYIYLLLHNAHTPLFIIYLMIVTDTDYKMRRLKSILYSLPFATVFTLMCCNPWTHLIFSINENLEYVRGPLFFVLYISACIYVYFGIYYLVRYGKSIGFRRSIGIGSVIPLILLSVLAQYFRPHLLLEMFAIAIALLLIASLIHRPEDILDPETGFSNKIACVDDVNRCIHNKKPLEIIIVNISNFDSLRSLINPSGMRMLHKIIAGKINSLNRTNVFAEMFHVGSGILILEMDYTKLSSTAAIASELNEMLKEPIVLNEMELSLTSYVCIVKCPQDAPNADILSHLAEDLNLVTYTGEVLIASELVQKHNYNLKRNIDTIIENAIANRLFRVYYQPIYDIEKKRFTSAEALIRLFDDTYGFISPDEFIPAAEKSGAIHRIGAFVLEEVCSFISSEEFKNLGIHYIEVNLSVAQCMRSDLTDEILGIMKRYNVEPSQINLEITETTASYSQDILQENVKRLNEAGISFSLDDYGTGYSNIERISSMMFDIIKLDKTFVNVSDSRKHSIVLEHTISMIKELGMKIVVEGVETKETLDRFTEYKCDYIQGYYFSKPVPRDIFAEFIKEKNNFR